MINGSVVSKKRKGKKKRCACLRTGAHPSLPAAPIRLVCAPVEQGSSAPLVRRGNFLDVSSSTPASAHAYLWGRWKPKALIRILCRLSEARSLSHLPSSSRKSFASPVFGIWECPPSVYHPYLWVSQRAGGTIYCDGVQTTVWLNGYTVDSVSIWHSPAGNPSPRYLTFPQPHIKRLHWGK